MRGAPAISSSVESAANSVILAYPDAAALLLHEATRLAVVRRHTRQLSLARALGQVLAEAVRADRDLPPFHRSTRDGYAVQAAALNAGNWLPVVGTRRAGESMIGEPLSPGSALEIMTGAPLPTGADAVVMLEHVETAKGAIRMAAGHTLRTDANVVAAGSEARAGDVVVPAGTRLGAAHIAALAAVGAAHVSVFAPPRVAILATGDELVPVGTMPLPHQIRNSNSDTLAAQVSLAGGDPMPLDVARDNLDDLRERIAHARRSADLLLLSGGVSAGKYDLVEEALAEQHARFHFTGVRIQPGKPTVFGELPPAGRRASPLAFFGLPGNPVSTMVTFLLFAAPLLRALAGENQIQPRFARAVLTELEPPSPLTRFLPALLESTWNGTTVRRIPWQGSGDLAATARSNCFVVLPPETPLAAGDPVQVLLPA